MAYTKGDEDIDPFISISAHISTSNAHSVVHNVFDALVPNSILWSSLVLSDCVLYMDKTCGGYSSWTFLDTVIIIQVVYVHWRFVYIYALDLP